MWSLTLVMFLKYLPWMMLPALEMNITFRIVAIPLAVPLIVTQERVLEFRVFTNVK